MQRRLLAGNLATAAVFAAVPLTTWAGGIPTTVIEEITVTGRLHRLQGTPASASQGVVTDEQLALRPVLRSGELMEVVPGLIVTQHSGDGKANQYFLRGFNLDHGTDLTRSHRQFLVLHRHGSRRSVRAVR